MKFHSGPHDCMWGLSSQHPLWLKSPHVAALFASVTLSSLSLCGCWNGVKGVTHGEQCLGELGEKLQEQRQRAFYLGHFLPWIVLEHGFVSPVTNIYF